MLQIKQIIVTDHSDAGCNNGKFHQVHITHTGGFLKGQTCACTRGCANTWNIHRIHIGDYFLDLKELLDVLEEKE